MSKSVYIGKAPKMSEPLMSGLVRLQLYEDISQFNKVKNILCAVVIKVAGTAYLHLSMQVEVVEYKVSNINFSVIIEVTSERCWRCS